ncbi:MAG TPA: hypothetical protein VJU53_06660 [Burkholderiaceae bacterium]|nr:hypothetical protein [Burkholderiaceae bacterium]
MRTWIVGLTFVALQAPASAVTLGEFASALAVPTSAKHSANNWSALKPIKGVKWRDATVKDAPSAFAQQADVALNGLGPATVLVVGARQMMLETEVSMRRLLERKGLAQTLKAQFSPATLIEQVGGDCRTKSGSGSARLYRVTLTAKRPLFMRLELPGAGNAATVFTLSVENKPQWTC